MFYNPNISHVELIYIYIWVVHSCTTFYYPQAACLGCTPVETFLSSKDDLPTDWTSERFKVLEGTSGRVGLKSTQFNKPRGARASPG